MLNTPINHFGNCWQVVYVQRGVSSVALYREESAARAKAEEVDGSVYPPNRHDYVRGGCFGPIAHLYEEEPCSTT